MEEMFSTLQASFMFGRMEGDMPGQSKILAFFFPKLFQPFLMNVVITAQIHSQ